MEMEASSFEVEVFFDGKCPLCTREIALLRKTHCRRRVRFTDIAEAAFDPASTGVSMQTLMARIHGRLPDGTLVEGVDVSPGVRSDRPALHRCGHPLAGRRAVRRARLRGVRAQSAATHRALRRGCMRGARVARITAWLSKSQELRIAGLLEQTLAGIDANATLAARGVGDAALVRPRA